MPEQWAELHDATLESLELRWSSGEVILRIRVGDPVEPHRVIVASTVLRFACDRQLPWGFSASINEVRGPVVRNNTSVLEIEMQSGDLIHIEASSFRLDVLG